MIHVRLCVQRVSTLFSSLFSRPSVATRNVGKATIPTIQTLQPMEPCDVLPQKIPKASTSDNIQNTKMLKRDQELLEKLLDRDGGCASVGIVDGKYEGGLGKETKKNMFRVI